jgi:hypothetical protein
VNRKKGLNNLQNHEHDYFGVLVGHKNVKKKYTNKQKKLLPILVKKKKKIERKTLVGIKITITNDEAFFFPIKEWARFTYCLFFFINFNFSYRFI